jgi:replicative DNA helicase
MKTGVHEIDSLWNAGLQRGGLIALAARPGMSKTRFLVNIGNLLSQKYKTVMISLDESEKMLKARNIADSIHVYDSPGQKIEDLEAQVKETSAEIVLLDYFQLLEGDRGMLIRELKKIAINANVCLIVTLQLGRGLERRDKTDLRPRVSDLIEGGFPESGLSHIDNLTFLYRDDYYNSKPAEPLVLELIQYENGIQHVVKLYPNYSDLQD